MANGKEYGVLDVVDFHLAKGYKKAGMLSHRNKKTGETEFIYMFVKGDDPGFTCYITRDGNQIVEHVHLEGTDHTRISSFHRMRGDRQQLHTRHHVPGYHTINYVTPYGELICCEKTFNEKGTLIGHRDINLSKPVFEI